MSTYPPLTNAFLFALTLFCKKLFLAYNRMLGLNYFVSFFRFEGFVYHEDNGGVDAPMDADFLLDPISNLKKKTLKKRSVDAPKDVDFISDPSNLKKKTSEKDDVDDPKDADFSLDPISNLKKNTLKKVGFTCSHLG